MSSDFRLAYPTDNTNETLFAVLEQVVSSLKGDARFGAPINLKNRNTPAEATIEFQNKADTSPNVVLYDKNGNPYFEADSEGNITQSGTTLNTSTINNSTLNSPLIKGGKINVGDNIASASSITIPDDVDAALITGTTAISTINGGAEGRVIRLYFESPGVRVGGTNIICQGLSYWSQVDSTIELFYINSKWREFARTGVHNLSVWLYQNGDQSIPHDTFTTVGVSPSPFAVIKNPGGLWNPANPSRLIDSAPLDGLYLIGGVMKWEYNIVGHRNIATYISTTAKTDNIDSRPPDPTSDTHQCFFTVKWLQVGEPLEIRVEQKSGGNLNIIGASMTDIVVYAQLLERAA